MTELKALDELYAHAMAEDSGTTLAELLEFARRAPNLGAYNAALVRIQREGCTYVATASEWRLKFSRDVVPGARPLVILWPFGPVKFVYDISDTEGDPVPEHILDPFASTGPVTDEGFASLTRAVARTGIAYGEGDHGPGSAGSLAQLRSPRRLTLNNEVVEQHYELVINRNLDVNARFATLMHELGHLFCGHLGPAADPGSALGKGIADRGDRTESVKEFEAESVSWLMCGRFGVDSPSGRYLSLYLDGDGALPPVSTEMIFKAVKRIESLLGDRETLGPLLRDDAPRLFRSS